jgi:hypothetical protein
MVRGGRDSYGEIDIVVLSPDSCLLLMEVKAGPVILRNGEVFKLYSDGECDVARQGRLQRVAMQNRLHEAKLETPMLCCLALPNYELGDSQVVSISRDQIIDATRYAEMVTTVREWMSTVRNRFNRQHCPGCCSTSSESRRPWT